jgi:hypothetical protein
LSVRDFLSISRVGFGLRSVPKFVYSRCTPDPGATTGIRTIRKLFQVLRSSPAEV